MKTYAIYWKSSVTGTVGTGTKRFEKEEAESLASELNEEFPSQRTGSTTEWMNSEVRHFPVGAND